MQLYDTYCLTDSLFYDSPAGRSDHGGPDGDAVSDGFLARHCASLPAGWGWSGTGLWTVVHPDDVALPDQGWKIHVSATPANAERVLAPVWTYCVEQRLCFKFLCNATVVLCQNSKYADRSASGKFVTIYPPDSAALERALTELGAILAGEPGPHVLTDLRWGDGPLYVRYGAFVDRECRTETGELVSAIEHPDGHLVPDVREPVFSPPAWAEPPACLQPALTRYDAPADDELPYDVEEVLHHSNGGGVYLARDPRTGDRVVLKEARPLAGLDRAGADAVSRLERECAMLRCLAGLPSVPAVREYRRSWEHSFLVESHIEGRTVSEEVVRRHPLLAAEPSDEQLAGYTGWALALLDEITAAVESVHARGVIFGDLHPHNIVVRPDGSVALVDFELASTLGEAWTPTLGAPGFAAPPDRRGFDIDRFALGCLRLSLFLPLTQLLEWDDSKLDELLGAVERRFPVPSTFASAVRAELAAPIAVGSAGGARIAAPVGDDDDWRSPAWPPHDLPDWALVRASLTAGILASATPARSDRLFPGDPLQFVHGGLGMAYGAAGVLWALHASGTTPCPEHREWLAAALARVPDLTAGFYDGLHGIAFALDAMGRPEQAVELVERALTLPIDDADVSLFSGAAGIGLNLLHFAARHAWTDHVRHAERLARSIVRSLCDRTIVPVGPGLLHGWSGPALFLVRLYETTGDSTWLEHAEQALRLDLDRCVWTEDGTLQVDEGWRVLPYLGVGTAGMGIVLDELGLHLPDSSLRGARAGIRRAVDCDLVIQSGLFNGRAGFILYLAHTSPADDAVLRSHLVSLGWHAVPYEGHVAFVGDQLMRLSMDLATGSAGVLLALGAALGDPPVTLPFLGPSPKAA